MKSNLMNLLNSIKEMPNCSQIMKSLDQRDILLKKGPRLKTWNLLSLLKSLSKPRSKFVT